jgi:hypothetical protein
MKTVQLMIPGLLVIALLLELMLRIMLLGTHAGRASYTGGNTDSIAYGDAVVGLFCWLNKCLS